MAVFDTSPQGQQGPATVNYGGQLSQSYPIVGGDIFEKISSVVRARFDQAEQHSRGRFERFYRYEKMVQMISKKKTYDWKANAYLPYALAVVEQSASIKVNSLLNARPYITVQPRQAGLEQVADHRQALLDWRFNGDVNLIRVCSEMFRIAEKYGKSMALCVPDWDLKTLRFREAVNLPTTYGPLSRIVWKSSQSRAYRIKVQPLDNTDVFVQPGPKRINGRDGMRWIIRRYYLTLAELQDLEANSLWGVAVGGQPTTEIRDTQEQSINEYKMRRLYMDQYDDQSLYRDMFDRTVEILEYQGWVPEELLDPVLAQQEIAAGLDPRQRVLTLANRKAVGINQAIPWDHGMKSYIEMDCIPDPYSFWGIGKIEPIEHLIYVGNEILNMRLDNVKAAINGIIGIDGSRMPAGWKRRLVSQPFGVVETQGPPQQIVQRLQLGDVTASAYQEQSQVFGLIQEASALNETLIGSPGGAVRTLGENQMKVESATRRLGFELMTQSNQLFGSTRENPGLVFMILSYDRQYLPLPQFISVVDPWAPDDMTNMTIGPTDLSEDDEHFIYVPQGAMQGMNKQAKRMEITQLNQMIMPMLQMLQMGGGFNAVAYVKQLFRTFDLDPDEFFPKVLGTLSPDALGMGQGPQGPAMGLQPGFQAGQPGQPVGMVGSIQPQQRPAGAGTPAGQNRYVGGPGTMPPGVMSGIVGGARGQGG